MRLGDADIRDSVFMLASRAIMNVNDASEVGLVGHREKVEQLADVLARISAARRSAHPARPRRPRVCVSVR